mmetsp:Transcript_8931/g.13394  ORF Transcript_8931/g.13394 Transcript_8931/m.13394 type:complete len:259 (-) Transcript_8931:578-1354(-)
MASLSNPSLAVMERAASSAFELPESNASEASSKSAPGSIEPIRRRSAVPGGTRCSNSTTLDVKTRQQSISWTRYTSESPWTLDPTTAAVPISSSSPYGNRNQSPYGPTSKTPKFFQCNTTLSSPHHAIDRGGEELPDEVLNSSTFDSNVVETTVKIELDVKHAKKRPLGANAMEIIGADDDPIPPPSLIRDLQSTSVNPLFGLVDGFASATTTEPSEVDKNNSGLPDGEYCRGSTAIHPNDKCFDLANMAVGSGVTIA